MQQKLRTKRTRQDGELGRVNDRSGCALHGSSFSSFLECLNTRLKSDDYSLTIPQRLSAELLKRYRIQVSAGAGTIESSLPIYRHWPSGLAL